MTENTQTPSPRAVTPPTGIASEFAPQNDAERDAVRKALQAVRQAKEGTTLPSLPENKPGLSVSLTDAANIVVQLPAEATLFVDSVKCPLTGEVRSFKTPTLENGKRYYYTLKVTDGNGTTEQKEITMTRGQTVQVDFRGMGATVPATQTVKR